MKLFLSLLLFTMTALAQSVTVTVAGQSLTFSLPLEVKSFKCTDSSGAVKTGFTAHGDTLLCNLAFAGTTPAGFSVTYKAVYSPDVPPSQQPLIFSPASMITNTGQIMIPQGSTDFSFTLTYP